MLLCVHQLLANCVCQLFAAQQVGYSEFISLFSGKNVSESVGETENPNSQLRDTKSCRVCVDSQTSALLL